MSTSIHAAKLFDNWLILQKVDANHKGLELGGIYELRVFRRETLHWINLLNRSSALLSRSLILHSNACNCSSSHTNFPFWNVLEIIDHLGISNCFDKRHDVDSNSKVVMILASSSTFTTLQSFLSEVVFLQTVLNCLCVFLANWMYALTWAAALSPLLRDRSSSCTVIFRSVKLSCMALQRSSKTSDRPSSSSTAFFCRVWQRLTWLLGVHIISSMPL